MTTALEKLVTFIEKASFDAWREEGPTAPATVAQQDRAVARDEYGRVSEHSRRGTQAVTASLTKLRPPREGLVPQSGDWEHPYRWVRGLVPKRIIDRLGRRTTRRIHPSETVGASPTNITDPRLEDLHDVDHDLGALFRQWGMDPGDDGIEETLERSKRSLDVPMTPMREMLRGWWNDPLGPDASPLHVLAAEETDKDRWDNVVTDLADTKLEKWSKLYEFPVSNAERYAYQQRVAEVRDQWKKILGPMGKVTVYRGVTLSEGDAELGPTVITDLPASSWTVSPSIATLFGHVILRREVTPDEIIASFLTDAELQPEESEGEIVVRNAPDGVDAEVVMVPKAWI